MRKDIIPPPDKSVGIELSIKGEDGSLVIHNSDDLFVQIIISGKRIWISSSDFIRGMKEGLSKFIDPKTNESLLP